MRLSAEHCLFCRQRLRETVRPYVCASCLSRLPFRQRRHALDFGLLQATLPATVRRAVICPFFYDPPIREAVLRMKFAGDWSAARALGPLMAEAAMRHDFRAAAIVPLPLHASRLRQRGFNQAERLATAMAHCLDLPVRGDALERVIPTLRQSEAADVMMRYRLVSGAFACRGDLPAAVYLVDDVMTTGATLAAAASALAARGISVQAVVCASNRGKPKLWPDRSPARSCRQRK